MLKRLDDMEIVIVDVKPRGKIAKRVAERAAAGKCLWHSEAEGECDRPAVRCGCCAKHHQKVWTMCLNRTRSAAARIVADLVRRGLYLLPQTIRQYRKSSPPGEKVTA